MLFLRILGLRLNGCFHAILEIHVFRANANIRKGPITLDNIKYYNTTISNSCNSILCVL